MRSVGRGGIVTSAELGIEGGDGMVAGVSTAMSVNG
jgi:hypothetical protein